MARNSASNSLGKFKKLEVIGEDYMKCLLALKTKNFKLIKKTKEEAESYVNTINYCIRKIKEPYSSILKNTFFNHSFFFWWIDYYKKSNFYKYRSKAINAFLNVYEFYYE